MAGSVTRCGLDMTGFVLELRGMCVVLGYPHGVDYQARPLPEQEGEDAEPHAGWEVTAVILSGSPERTSLVVTAGGDSFPAACQNAALLAIGTLHQRYPDELQHSPYRYHPRRGGARDYATFRDASSEDDATIMHLARIVEAYDTARIDFHRYGAPWFGREQHEDPGAASGEPAAQEGPRRSGGAAASAQDRPERGLSPQASPRLPQPEDHRPQEHLQARACSSVPGVDLLRRDPSCRARARGSPGGGSLRRW